MKIWFVNLSVAVAAVLLNPVPAPAAPIYRITDLGPGIAKAINQSGQIIGENSSTYKAFLYSAGVKEDLPWALNTFQPLAINNNGEIVGAGQNHSQALLLKNGVLQNLGNLGGAASAYGINDSGQVTGGSAVSLQPSSYDHTFLYSNGMMTDLNIGSSSEGIAINATGQIAGGYTTPQGEGHAYLYSGALQDLGTLGGLTSGARGINNSGQVVGYSVLPDGFGNNYDHAFLYSDGAMQDLGTVPGQLQSEAWAINNTGQVTGESYLRSQSTGRTFLYASGVMRDLNSLITPGSGWVLIQGYGINDSGQIVGWGTFNGQSHAFLASPVPEPSAIVLVAIAFAGLLVRARRIRGRSASP